MNLDHLSYSTLSQFKSCPRAVYLRKVRDAEAVPAWYFVVGSAVHRYIEHCVRGDGTLEVDVFFWDEYGSALRIEPDSDAWLCSGGKSSPLVRNELALELARACAREALRALEDLEVWEIEFDATGLLPGCDVPVKAFIDCIGEHKKHGPVIVDWKTGKQKPKDALQLETYNALLRASRGPLADAQGLRGLWVMLNPDASTARPVAFKETPESMGAMYAEVARRMRADAWPAVPQFNCQFCTQRFNCKMASGSTARTRFYDVMEGDSCPF